jgi:hypothetical protein
MSPRIFELDGFGDAAPKKIDPLHDVCISDLDILCILKGMKDERHARNSLGGPSTGRLDFDL